MARVFPFHGYHYNSGKIGNLNQVVTPPYDKIDRKSQKYYYNKHPYNIVRLILNKAEGQNKYQKAAVNLKKWIEKDIVARDEEACFYAYWQEYKINGERKVRKGFVGLGEIEEGDGIKAHEETMEGPKADRLNLIRATAANFGHIFMLYSDPEGKVNQILDKNVGAGKPLLTVKDDDGNQHKLWRILAQDKINLIKKWMKPRNLYIADGHHRYQTALNYKKECEAKGWQAVGDEGFNHRMMTFVNLDAPDLTILPTHRLLHGLSSFETRDFIKEIKREFTVKQFADREDMYQSLTCNQEQNIFGYKGSGDDYYYTLILKNRTIMDKLIPDHSPTWRNLDVSVLHKAILERYLGIDKQALKQKENIDYIRDSEQALKLVENEEYQAAFFLNPTKIEEVKEIADNGEKMPQKSTDFYPKLLTGMVFHKMAIIKN